MSVWNPCELHDVARGGVALASAERLWSQNVWEETLSLFLLPAEGKPNAHSHSATRPPSLEHPHSHLPRQAVLRDDWNLTHSRAFFSLASAQQKIKRESL